MVNMFCVLCYILAESQKPPGLLSIGADEGARIHILSGRACKTYIIKTHMKHTHLPWWNVCDAYVKRMCSASENICEPYVKYM